MKENQKNKIDEHDMTKKMMETIRGGFRKVIKEGMEGDSIKLGPNDTDYEADLEGLQNINPSAQITNLMVYPNEPNVILDGKTLPNEGANSGLNFTFGLRTGEAKIQMEGLNDLNDVVIKAMEALKGHYVNWCNEWWRRLKEEPKYKKQNGENDENTGF